LATGAGEFVIVGGGQVLKNDQNSEKTSVTPAWRKTLMHYLSSNVLPIE
jgi:hypothetical protein